MAAIPLTVEYPLKQFSSLVSNGCCISSYPDNVHRGSSASCPSFVMPLSLVQSKVLGIMTVFQWQVGKSDTCAFERHLCQAFPPSGSLGYLAVLYLLPYTLLSMPQHRTRAGDQSSLPASVSFISNFSIKPI